MQKIRIVAVGKLKESFWREAVAEYVKRLSRFAAVEMKELAERATIEEEAKEILAACRGLAAEVKRAADFKLSFSDMTLPHQLMRVVLCEQVYRAFMINAGSVYHK